MLTIRNLLLLVGIALLALPVSAASDEKASDPPAVSPTAGFPDQVLRAWLANTDLARMLRRDASADHITKSREGLSFNPNGGDRSVIVARIGADGKHALACVMSEAQAEAFIERPSRGEDKSEP